MTRNSPEHRQFVKIQREKRDIELKQKGFHGFSFKCIRYFEKMGLKNLEEVKRIVIDRTILKQPGFGLKAYQECCARFKIPIPVRLSMYKQRQPKKMCPHCNKNIYELYL